MIEPIEITDISDPDIACRGLCDHCGREHSLPVGPAMAPALALFHRLEREGRIDFDVPVSEASPWMTTDYVWSEARGQMFGVLVVRDQSGRTGVIKAFSGQYNSRWRVPGWVGPLLDVERFRMVTALEEKCIKQMSREFEQSTDAALKKTLADARKKASRNLQRRIHSMFLIPSFAHGRSPLPMAACGTGGIPTGTGDCCAPKLLGYAALNGLTPLGLAEFYFGRTNRSGTREHGTFYPSCKDKCGRILGYMLCGLEDARQ
ncbi:hypothetical protein [Pseudodesulfovibrio sediminis]|uniref:Uncharacterized protein n=1 Tax=Pseudodesulfovibrio sediminis TaxID=2810563 RepID=A0ABM7P9C8_9BACT|nr:hypothetical protein [Pseudodesulfovibrio sediminis]BCS89594.1 hypothetical protein PSDVSF_28360 [Pseudodesulfovibrio sediminis]